jgi:hypothetical protein
MAPQLTSLTVLRASPYTLFGCDTPNQLSEKPASILSDALPNTIEHLWLDIPCRPWKMDLAPYFTHLFKAHTNITFPHLKSIHIDLYEKTAWSFDIAVYYLQHLLKIRSDASVYAPAINFDVSIRLKCIDPGKSSQNVSNTKNKLLSRFISSRSWSGNLGCHHTRLGSISIVQVPQI